MLRHSTLIESSQTMIHIPCIDVHNIPPIIVLGSIINTASFPWLYYLCLKQHTTAVYPSNEQRANVSPFVIPRSIYQFPVLLLANIIYSMSRRCSTDSTIIVYSTFSFYCQKIPPLYTTFSWRWMSACQYQKRTSLTAVAARLYLVC